MNKLFHLLITFIFSFSLLNAYERTVLAEIFTSTTCPPCATQNPYFDNWLKNYTNKDRVAVIKYHTWWPSPGNDPFYHANTVENQARVNYYSTNYVPRGIINGTSDGTSSAATWISLIQNSIVTSSQFDIKIYGNVDATQGGNLTIRVTADNNPIPSGTLVLHTVVVESDLYYTGTNGDPVHQFVMRKMYPNHNGETFTITPNETKTFSRVFSWNSTWKIDNSHIVVFIQNQSNRQVYQAAIRKANVFLASPLPVFPPNNSLNQPINITLRWNRISQATNYGLEISTDSLFNTKIFSDSTLVDTFRTITKLTRETRYYWRVKAISSFAISDWSPVYSFKTLPQNAPSQVQLVSPANGVVIGNPGLIQFSWLQSQPDVDYYRFELASDSNFVNYIVDTMLTTTSFSYNFTHTTLSECFWRVTARNGVGWGSSSEARNIKFIWTSIYDKTLPVKFELYQNHPNPFNPKTTIVYELPYRSHITIRIYNLLGNLVEELVSEMQEAGRYAVEWDAGEHSSGVYFYELRSTNFRSIKKMMLTK